ncbi:MAG: ABC transporter permease [Parvibaculaceae bacterium]
MMREVKTRFGESHLGFAWLFIEPLIFIIPIVVFWSMRGHTQHGLPLVEFILTGYPPFILWRNCVSRSRAAISGNSGLLYHRMITPARIVLARCLLEIAASFISIGITYIIFIYIQWAKPPAIISYFLLGWLYMAAISWASAVFLSALTEVSVVMAKIIGTLTYLMLAIGGVFYMVEWMPNSLHPYLVWVPTVQAFELIRDGYFGDAVKAHWSLINMIFCFLVPATLGLHILGFAREHLELE